jgi:hypothetical protein
MPQRFSHKSQPHNYIYTFRLTKPEDLGEGLVALLHEAYAVGQQEHRNAPAAGDRLLSSKLVRDS